MGLVPLVAGRGQYRRCVRAAIDHRSYGWDYPQYAAMRGDADLYFKSFGAPRNLDKRFYLYNHLEAAVAAPYFTDPRAKRLLREAGFETYWREKGWPALCRPLGETDFECAPAAP